LEHIARQLGTFIDDCANGTIRPRWPFPWPPDGDPEEALRPAELIIMGVHFRRAAAEVAPQLAEQLTKAGDALIDLGSSRMH